MSDLILAEERRSADETFTKPVMRDGGILDPAANLVLQDAKDFFEVDLRLDYDEDEIRAQVSVTGNQPPEIAIPSESTAILKEEEKSPVKQGELAYNIYDEQSVVFVDP